MQASCHPGDPIASTGYVALFLTGLIMSAGHCAGMCGPIQVAFSLQQAKVGGVRWSLLWYHLGRVSAYALIGLVLGILGSSVGWVSSGTRFQGTVSLVAGLLMIILAVASFVSFPHLGETAVSRLVSRVIPRLLAVRNPAGRFGLGVANGFLPCGPLWAIALTGAAAAHPATGALFLASFGLGTVPLLVILGLTAGSFRPQLRRRFTRIGMAAVIIIGIQLGLRGLAVFGLVPHGHIGPVTLW